MGSQTTQGIASLWNSGWFLYQNVTASWQGHASRFPKWRFYSIFGMKGSFRLQTVKQVLSQKRAPSFKDSYMPEAYLRAYLRWNHCHSDVGSKSIKEKSPNVFSWEDVADHIEFLFQERDRSCSVRLGFVSKIVAGRCIVLKTTPASSFLSITPTLIFSANESSIWSLNYYCDHQWWNWERIWYFSYSLLHIKDWNSASSRRCAALRVVLL